MAEPAEKLPATVDEFLRWSEGRPGRFELVCGRVVAMAPETSLHAKVKGLVYRKLAEAVEAGNLPCEVYPDGMTVRVDAATAFEPDALLRCGEPLALEAVEVPDPLLVVEVLSPSSGSVDTGRKFEGYFRVFSVRHYLIVDPERRVVIHHERASGDEIRSRVLRGGILRLEPPGIEIEVEALFPPAGGSEGVE